MRIIRLNRINWSSTSSKVLFDWIKVKNVVICCQLNMVRKIFLSTCIVIAGLVVMSESTVKSFRSERPNQVYRNDYDMDEYNTKQDGKGIELENFSTFWGALGTGIILFLSINYYIHPHNLFLVSRTFFVRNAWRFHFFSNFAGKLASSNHQILRRTQKQFQ